MKKVVFLLSIALTLIIACKKTEAVIENPYDKLTRDTIQLEEGKLDPKSLAGIHKNVFVKTCANSGCHDGTFEPDFRTAESSYNTMINAAVVKPDPAGTLKYRVVPGNADASMLVYRMTVDLGGNSGIMPLVINPGNDYESKKSEYIQNIKDWINAGAPDLNGNIRSAVDFPPTVLGVNGLVAGNPVARGGKYEPLQVPAGSNVQLLFSLTDDNQTQDELSNTKIVWSTNPADYSMSTFYPLSKVAAAAYNGLYGSAVDHLFSYTFNSSAYAVGDVIWFRIQCDDSKNKNVQLPNDNSMFILKKYFAIKII